MNKSVIPAQLPVILDLALIEPEHERSILLHQAGVVGNHEQGSAPGGGTPAQLQQRCAAR